MEILPVRRTLATETRQIDGFIESLSCELQELFRARRIPAPVRRIAAEPPLDLCARERLLHAAADMGLALLEHAAVPGNHLDLAGSGLRLRTGRIPGPPQFANARNK